MKLTDEELKAIVALLEAPASQAVPHVIPKEHIHIVAKATEKDADEARKIIEFLWEARQVVDTQRQAKPDEKMTMRWKLTSQGASILGAEVAAWLQSHVARTDVTISWEHGQVCFSLPGTSRDESIALPFSQLDIARIASKDEVFKEHVLTEVEKVVRETRERVK